MGVPFLIRNVGDGAAVIAKEQATVSAGDGAAVIAKEQAAVSAGDGAAVKEVGEAK